MAGHNSTLADLEDTIMMMEKRNLEVESGEEDQVEETVKKKHSNLHLGQKMVQIIHLTQI